jgi:hypothetical protein
MVRKQNLQMCQVTRETIRAVERREAEEISARKKSIIGILGNVAELGASRMEETIGEASLRDAAIGTGIAVDKLLALTGDPSMTIKIVEPFDFRAALEQLNREAREILNARAKVIETNSPPLLAAGTESETQTRLQG